MSILFGLVYCSISPIITPLVFLYFVINLMLSKYQVIYVLRRAYESGGLVSWPSANACWAHAWPL